jgi:hypothetical protein
MSNPQLTMQQIGNLRREDAEHSHGAWKRPRGPKRQGRARRAIIAMRSR